MNFKSPKFRSKITRVFLIVTGWIIAAITARVIQYISIKYIAQSDVPSE